MGERAEQLVREGNSFIAIDLSPLNYIYSDSINRFINLNRTILDINGRIVIMATHPKVIELLDKAGVQNFIKVVDNEDALIKISQMMAPQQPAAPVSAPAPVQMPAPVQIDDAEDAFGSLQASLNEEPAVEVPVQPPVSAPTPTPVQAPKVEEVKPVVEKQVTPSEQPDTAFPEENMGNPFAEDEDDPFAEKKKSPVVLIAVIIVLLAAIGGGTLFFLGNKSNSKSVTKPVVAKPIVKDLGTTATDTSEKVSDTVTEEKLEKSKVVKKKKSKKSYTRRKKSKKSSKPKKIAGDVIMIYSNPTGAMIVANGKHLGTTPYTWNNPTAYGDLRLVITKSGYEDVKYALEYLGGKEEVAVTLRSSSAGQSSSASRSSASTQTVQDNSAAEAQAAADQLRREQEAQAQASAAEQAKALEMRQKQASQAKAQEQQQKADAAKKAEAQRVAEAAAKAEAAKKAQAAATATSKASIYFNSLPPMADIYENGKLIGKTNMKPIETTTGSHTYTFKKAGRTAKTTVNLRSGKNNAPMIRLQ